MTRVSVPGGVRAVSGAIFVALLFLVASLGVCVGAGIMLSQTTWWKRANVVLGYSTGRREHPVGRPHVTKVPASTIFFTTDYKNTFFAIIDRMESVMYVTNATNLFNMGVLIDRQTGKFNTTLTGGISVTGVANLNASPPTLEFTTPGLPQMKEFDLTEENNILYSESVFKVPCSRGGTNGDLHISDRRLHLNQTDGNLIASSAMDSGAGTSSLNFALNLKSRRCAVLMRRAKTTNPSLLLAVGEGEVYFGTVNADFTFLLQGCVPARPNVHGFVDLAHNLVHTSYEGSVRTATLAPPSEVVHILFGWII